MSELRRVEANWLKVGAKRLKEQFFLRMKLFYSKLNESSRPWSVFRHLIGGLVAVSAQSLQIRAKTAGFEAQNHLIPVSPQHGFGTKQNAFASPQDAFETKHDGFGSTQSGFEANQNASRTKHDGYVTPSNGFGTEPNGFEGKNCRFRPKHRDFNGNEAGKIPNWESRK